MKPAMIAAIALMPFAVSAQGVPEGAISEAGTAFMRHCLADVTDSRVALLREKAPDFASSLSEEDLREGGMEKARKACPCFLHVIGVSPLSEGETPEEKTAIVVRYLDSVHGDEAGAMPPVLGTITKNCGERSSVLPLLWLGR